MADDRDIRAEHRDESTLFVMHHTHWDREWYQSFPELQVRLRDALRHVSALLRDGRIDNFFLDGQTCVLDDYRETVSDEEFSALEKLISEGKIEVGPWYVLADEFLCPAEVMVKNLQIGMDIAKRYGSFCGMGYLPDTFGHAGSIPMLLNNFGISRALIWRGADPHSCLVSWVSSDGSAVRTFVLPTRDGYFQVGTKNREYFKGLDEYIRFLSEEKDCPLLFYPEGADHTVCSADVTEKLRRYAAEKGLAVRDITMQELCRRLDGCEVGETLRGELRDNSKVYVLSGTWSSRSYLKAMNDRCAARLTYETEFLAAWERDRSDSSAFRTRLWKRLLVNQAHDSICGCSIDDVHDDMVTRYREIESSADAFRDSVFEALYPFVYDRQDCDNLFLHIINPLPYATTRMVKARIFLPLRLDKGGIALRDNGNDIPLNSVTREVKVVFFHNSVLQPWYETVAVYDIEFPVRFDGMESRCLRIVPCEARADAAFPACDGEVENEFYRLEIRDGALYVLDKRNKKGHARQHILRSSLDAGDTYNYAPPVNDTVSAATVTGIQKRIRTHSCELELTYEMELPAGLNTGRTAPSGQTVTLKCRSSFTLYRDDPVIHVETEIENTACDHRLTVGFDVGDCKYHCSDGMFEWVRRKTLPVPPLPVPQGKEVIPGQDPTATRLTAGELQIVHMGLHEYTVTSAEQSCECSLTLMRCVGFLSCRTITTRGGGAGPNYATPGAQCLGKHVFNYGLVYGSEKFAPSQAVSFRAPVLFRQSCTDASSRKLLTLPESIHFSALGYEDGRFYLHLFNPGDTDEVFRFDGQLIGAVRKTDLAHTFREELIDKDSVHIPPHSLGCYLIEPNDR